MNSPNRRKACEVQIEKQAYLRHINRLRELKSGKSAEQLRRNYQEKKLAYTLNTVRKMHAYNRQYKQRQMKQVQQESKDTNFNKVKSVVTNDFNWPIPIIAPKHKRNPRPILNQNLKIFERIIKAKTKVEALNETYTERKKKTPLPYISSSDFSKLYESSRVNENSSKILKLKLGKCKKYFRAYLLFDFSQIFDLVKDLDSMYIIEVSYQDFTVKSPSFILGQLEKTKIILRVGEKFVGENSKSLRVKLIKILDTFQKKQVCKAKFQAEIDNATFSSLNKENSELHELNMNNYYSYTQSPRDILVKNLPKSNGPTKQQFLNKNSQKFTIKLRLQKQPKTTSINPKIPAELLQIKL